jgi:hypothetical protein
VLKLTAVRSLHDVTGSASFVVKSDYENVGQIQNCLGLPQPYTWFSVPILETDMEGLDLSAAVKAKCRASIVACCPAHLWNLLCYLTLAALQSIQAVHMDDGRHD